MSTNDQRLALICYDDMVDWYTIEWAEHAGITDLRMHPEGYMYLYLSARPSDADIEGSAAEMLIIAEAIEAGDDASFKRCAVRHYDGTVHLWSPRNSTDPAIVSVEVARNLAAEIIEKLGAA
ncbi:MAG TPA: hypothetical protein VMW48_02400 [Vicinamibacterales bacterium]|nr:hypothetical protein [Vicinamibacterales bacterium]